MARADGDQDNAQVRFGSISAHPPARTHQDRADHRTLCSGRPADVSDRPPMPRFDEVTARRGHPTSLLPKRALGALKYFRLHKGRAVELANKAEVHGLL